MLLKSVIRVNMYIEELMMQTHCIADVERNAGMKSTNLSSKQAAIDALISESRIVDSRYILDERIIIESDAIEAISMLPSAEKTGKWIKENKVLTSNPPQYVWHCSECSTSVYGFSSGILTPYCHNCGAKMELEEK